MIRTLEQLRSFAVARTFFPATTFDRAFDTLGFVQADPIRAPARAQELILRHRVSGYRVGDLARQYESANLEEGVLYAYGYLQRSNWELLRTVRASALSRMERAVLDALTGRLHASPKDVEAHIGRRRATNDWGRQATAASVALARLQHRGLVRITGRDRGLKRYTLAPPPATSLSPEERYRMVILLAVRVLSPLPERTLRRVAARLRRLVGCVRSHTAIIEDLCRSEHLTRHRVEAVDYVWPTTDSFAPTPRHVRFLAPFDPLVWDREKFEHLWGWTYRFEAYTPPAKRVRGYYAMPLLFGDDVVGWANVASVAGHGPRRHLAVDVGFVSGRRPAGREFTNALEQGIAALEAALTPRPHANRG